MKKNDNIDIRLQELSKSLEELKEKKGKLEKELSLKGISLVSENKDTNIGSVEEAEAVRLKLQMQIDSLSSENEKILSSIKSVLGSLKD